MKNKKEAKKAKVYYGNIIWEETKAKFSECNNGKFRMRVPTNVSNHIGRDLYKKPLQ